ncbi:MAG: efflux RND transporter periplasmic adaptor subunit [Myxococcota bacterium]
MNTATLPAMSARRWLRAAALLVGVALAVAVARRDDEAPAATPAERGTPWLEDGFIRYPESFARREQLAFAPAEERLLTPSLAVTGRVTYDARRVAAVGARIEGRIQRVLHVEGETVRAGEVMAELESAELGRAQAEVLKVRAREKVAKLDAERERKLADAHISPERDAEHAAANARALEAERIAAEKSVEALGGAVDGPLGVLKLKSPLDGRVVELHVKRGQTVEPSDTLFVVADLSRVWVELTVFERDLAAVREGDEVDVRVPSAPGVAHKGVIAHVPEVIDEAKRAAEVRVELENDGALRPGLAVTATIHASGPREARLTVPRAAVTRVDGKPTVFVQAGEGRVEPRQVTLGPEDAQHVAVEDGLAAGERVVVSGVLALKAEVFR